MPQDHGGALLDRGLPGNLGGRPSSELRARLRGSLAERVGIAEEIADNPAARDADRLGALGFLARFGLGTSDENVVEVAGTGGDAMQALRQALVDELERLGPEAFTAELKGLLDERTVGVNFAKESDGHITIMQGVVPATLNLSGE